MFCILLVAVSAARPLIKFDQDNDGLKNSEEMNTYFTDPKDSDTDDDGLSDGDEVKTYFTDPTNEDSDGDTINDNSEISTYGTDPNNEDSDGDGVIDPLDLVLCYDTDGGHAYEVPGTVTAPIWYSTGDVWSAGSGTDECQSNGYIAEYYCFTETDAYFGAQPCTTAVGPEYVCIAGACVIPDEDVDSDGIISSEEEELGTSPTDADTDDDGLTDGDEVNTYGTDPTSEDTDGDWLTDNDELSVYGTDPVNEDTDGDISNDGSEVSFGTDPLDASSYMLPDLVVGDETSLYLEGDAYYVADGTVVGYHDLSGVISCTVRNDGDAPAVGSRSSDHAIYNSCFVSADSGSNYITYAADQSTSTINPGETLVITVADSSVAGNVYPILQDIYDGIAPEAYVQYYIDHGTNTEVAESDETNNEVIVTVPLDASMYNFNWVEVECGSTVGCGDGYICTNYVCGPISSGDSTYS